jgi:hypothetical protein
MATISIQLNDTMVGTIISPAADGYITYLKKTLSTPYHYQVGIESWFPLPRPHGVWKTGRLVLRRWPADPLFQRPAHYRRAPGYADAVSRRSDVGMPAARRAVAN